MEDTPRMDAPTYRNYQRTTKRKRIGRTTPERDMQQALITWARLNPLLEKHLLSIPNERKCSPQEGFALKAMGLMPGASDLLLALPKGFYSGFFIELKSPGEKPTQLQLNFLERMAKVGYKTAWFDDWLQAAAAIKKYLEL